MNKSLITIIIILVVLVGGYFLFFNKKSELVPEVSAPEVEVFDAVEYFSKKLQEKHVAEVGQPIEGFTPEMFMNVFPGLVASDFEGVEAMGGVYKVEEGEAIFERTVEQLITSADGAVNAKGMKKLLENVSLRLGFEVDDRSSVDVILQTLKQPPAEPKG